MNYLRIRFRAIQAICLCGPSLLQAHAQFTDPAFLSSSVTFERVSNVVKEGVSRDAVIETFGQPFTHDKISNLEWEDSYFQKSPKRLEDAKEGFSGFEVRYLSNRVENWSPIESGPIVLHTNNTPLESLAGSSNIANIGFHVVYEPKEPIPGWRYIDTPAFPHLGNIRSNADFVAQDIPLVELKECTLFPRGAGKEYHVIIHLSDSQADAFASLSTRKSGKTMAVLIDNELVAAPLIREPIKGGIVTISFRDQKDAEDMMKRLRKQTHPDP